MGAGKSSLALLRSKGMVRGLDAAGETELISLVIGACNHRSGGAIAQELIDHFGGLAGMATAAVEELSRFEGVGPASAMRLKASFELGKRSVISIREGAIRRVKAPGDVAALMTVEMCGLDREHFKAILLDTKNGIRKVVTVAVGSLNAALVHPRELFKAAVAASAAGIILVHNHPTGNPEPSVEDTELTLRFVKCGELMGIELVDHIIIGGDRFVSMRERGLIA